VEAHAAKQDAVNFDDGKFMDPEFPAADTSLYWQKFPPTDPAMEEGIAKIGQQVRKWERAQIIQEGSLWGTGLSDPEKSFGLKQGLINNAWFVGAASAVGEVGNGNLLKRLIVPTEYATDGLFEVQLYMHGKPYRVTIDDRLPLYSAQGTEEQTPIAFEQSEDGSWWPAILEKAFAKMSQNYARTDGGLQFEALRTLTGLPTIAHLPMYFKEQYPEEKIAEILARAESKGHIVTAGLLENHEGLSAGHPYTVGGIDKIQVDGEEVTLVRLRNPWAKERYAGPYAPNDPIWTPELKTQVQFEARVKKGAFWMALTDFSEAFGQLAIAHTEDSW